MLGRTAFFWPSKNFDGDILSTCNFFRRRSVDGLAAFLRNPKKACGFEKHGFQNHKAAANMGFCASWA
jgi:hypothetical protein